MMARLLPWCMKQMGYDQWLPVLEAAIAETKLTETEPKRIPDGCFVLHCDLPESMQDYPGKITLTFLDKDDEVISTTWPDERL